MSYILGALKKADQERRRESDVRIADWDQDSWDDPTSTDNTSRWLIGLVVFVLVLVLSVFGFIAFRVLEAVAPDRTVVAETSEPMAAGESPTGGVAQNPADATLAATNRIEQQEANASEAEMAQPSPASSSGLGSGSSSVRSEPPVDQSFMPDFSGHLYFPGNSGLSRVFANSSSYREGDTINGYRVEQILEDELVLSNGEQEIRINMRN